MWTFDQTSELSRGNSNFFGFLVSVLFKIVSVIQQSDFLGTIFHSTQAVIFWAWGGLSQKQVNITWLFNLIKPNEPFLEVPTHYYLGRSTHYFIHHKSPQNVSLFPKRIFTRSLPGFALLEVIHDIRMMFLVFWLIHSVWEKNLGEMQFFLFFSWENRWNDARLC